MQLQREKETRRRDPSSAGLLPKWLQLPVLGQVEAMNQEFPSGFLIWVVMPAALSSVPAGHWIESEAAATQSGTHMGCCDGLT